MSRILVTGSEGAIGAPLCRYLRAQGHRVFGLDIKHKNDEMAFSVGNDFNFGRRYVRADVANYRQLERAIFDRDIFPDFIYHTAAEFGRWNGEDFYENLWRTNVIGTKNILRLQEEYGFKLIFFSSSEVYGDYNGVMKESVTEENFIPLLNDYAMTKWVGEMQIRNSRKLYGTKTVIVRLFNVYGPGEYYSPYRSVNCRFLYYALKGSHFLVHRGHKRTSTYIDDAVRTLSKILVNFKDGAVYNIASDQQHTIERLAEIALEVTGADADLVHLVDSEPMTTKEKKVDCSLAIRDLDHKTTVSLEDGMKRTAKWMREVYHL